ncbi:MAG TPA: DUF5076 domain-containing protein [Gemmatimonadaceae bacterium]|nr:DUF5076 domain-containing protein [Gemmatimonadaceae bacterium]
MAYPKDQLPPPPAALDDARAFELARVWFAGEAPVVTARLEPWPDPAAWGLLLGDVARQVARMYAERGDVDAAAALARLRAGLDAELGDGGDHDAWSALDAG